MSLTPRLSKPVGFAFTFVAAFALQGCVAAVLPIAASGYIGNRALSGDDDDSEQAALAASTIAPEDVATSAPEDDPINADLVPVTTAASAANTAVTAPAAARTPLAAPPPPAATPPVKPIAAPAAAPGPALAATSAASPSPPPGASPASSVAINQLLSFANQRQIGSGELPASAMLSDRLTLQPERAECNAITPTVLIDLDPEDGLFDPQSASRPPSGLGVGLARLRLTGVAIAWISGNSMEQEGAIRAALARSGLDINEEDRLLLLRSPDDRKQTLREGLAGVTCLIAIAGDTRSDFDELYDYLLNPADAQSLEPLIGDGWFLIPQPLLSERANS